MFNHILNRCLGADESECPTCARDHGIIAEIRRNNMRLAGQNELFLNEVKEGGFESLAAGFGRGWFEIPPP
jgi:vacuolar protein sorting-associated protein 11